MKINKRRKKERLLFFLLGKLVVILILYNFVLPPNGESRNFVLVISGLFFVSAIDCIFLKKLFSYSKILEYLCLIGFIFFCLIAGFHLGIAFWGY